MYVSGEQKSHLIYRRLRKTQFTHHKLNTKVQKQYRSKIQATATSISNYKQILRIIAHEMANPTSHRNFAPQHSKKIVAPRICNTFAMGNTDSLPPPVFCAAFSLAALGADNFSHPILPLPRFDHFLGGLVLSVSTPSTGSPNS
jgi:hypothetical protein